MEFERGQVWYVRYDDSIGDEMAVGRAVLIISSDEDIKDLNTVICVFMTTGLRKSKRVVTTYFNGRKQYVHCSQVYTFAKERLTEYIGKMNESQMCEIDRVVQCATKNIKLEESPKVESKNDGDYVDLLVERDMYKRLYEMAVSKLTSIQFEQDTKVKVEEPKKELSEEEILSAIDKLEEKPVKKAPKKIVESVEKKRCGRPPISGKYVRPTAEDLVEYKKNGKANVNTDDWKTIAATTGMSVQTAQNITAYRNKHGKYRDLVDLLNVARFGSITMDRYGSKLEV